MLGMSTVRQARSSSLSPILKPLPSMWSRRNDDLAFTPLSRNHFCRFSVPSFRRRSDLVKRNVQFDAFYQQNWISPKNGEIITSSRWRKSLYYDYSWRWRMEKTQVNVQRIHIARNRKDSRRSASIDAKPRTWSSLKYWDCYSYWCSWYWSASTRHWVLQDAPYGFWQVVVTKDLWMKFIVTTPTLWIAVSSLRTKEESFDNVGFESFKLAVVNHEQGSQDSNSVKTKDESSGVLWETVASTMRVTSAPRKKAAAAAATAAAILCQYIQEESPFSKRERSPKRTDFGHDSRMPEMQKLASPSVSRICFDTMIKMNEKQMERCIGMLHLQGWTEDSNINWRKNLQTRIGSIAFILEASRRDLKSVKMKMEKWDIFVRSRAIEVEWSFQPRLMKYVMIPYRWKQFVYHVGWARGQY